MGILSKKTYGLLIAALCAAMLPAQTVSIDAKIDTAAIWIGDQTNLTFEIAQPADSTVILPIWTDRLIDGIEIVEQNPLDTVSLRLVVLRSGTTVCMRERHRVFQRLHAKRYPTIRH